MRSKLFDDGEYLSLIEEKIKQYQDECPICLYKCPSQPEQKDILCQNNKCVDARFTSLITDEEEKIESVFNTFLLAEKICDIDLANYIITEKSKEIMHYTCANMATEYECYKNITGDDYKIYAKNDKAILHFDSFSNKEGWPFFFAKEEGEWKIDFHKMAFGISMGGGGCATGWGWRNDEIVEEFCSYFETGKCPDKQ